jgi:Arc/MetJ-type ribon-helix-helix transcriptional regulator
MTITVHLPEKLEAELRARLEMQGLALSDFVRDAIVEKLGREPAEKPSASDLGKHLFGKHGSGGTTSAAIARRSSTGCSVPSAAAAEVRSSHAPAFDCLRLQ